MKTAISVPDRTFNRASQKATDLGMSRSEFFSRAAERYLDELELGALTSQIDAGLAGIDQDDETSAAVVQGIRVLGAFDEEW